MQVTPNMNGAESLVRTLVASGVEVCFANPGTSEMHFVDALDRVAGMRCVLGLFEGVVTGAADGYYRMTGKPAATLLHLGPGLGNGLANLHNAKKAHSGIVNVVGEHASYHVRHDAPLTSDIEAIARPMSHWVRTSHSACDVAQDGARAVEAARTAPGQVATLILPADTAWNAAQGPALAREPSPRQVVSGAHVAAAAQALRQAGSALLLGGIAMTGRSLELAGRIATATGCRILGDYNAPRIARGAGRVIAQRVPYAVDAAVKTLADLRCIVLVGSRPPVSFFGYPDKPSLQAPAACAFTRLAGIEEDIEGALEALADLLQARALAPRDVARLDPPGLPSGPLTTQGIAAVLGALMPENAIVVDESITTGRGFGAFTTHAQPHDWIVLTGGSIGFGLPAAVGTALACPQRKVIALEGDGSAMYTLQSLWTMARENLDVTVLVFANRSYSILHGELANVGAGTPGRRANDMLSLDRPALDWVSLASGHGVEGRRVSTLDELAQELRRALSKGGPTLIEVVL